MNTQAFQADPTIGRCARAGVRVGVRAALAYAALFIIYAIVRSSGAIAGAGEIDAGVLPTMAGNALSLVFAATSITTLILVPVSILGALTGVLCYGIHRIPRWRNYSYVGSAAGVAAAALLLGGIGLSASDLMGGSMREHSPETWWFWFGLPGLIWITMAGVIGRDLVARNDSSANINRFEQDHGTDRSAARTAPLEQTR
jgi:hypothetical protein